MTARESDFRGDPAVGRAGMAAEVEQAVDDTVTTASGGPEDPEDMAVADDLTATDAQAEHYREMTRRGAAQSGEGSASF